MLSPSFGCTYNHCRRWMIRNAASRAFRRSILGLSYEICLTHNCACFWVQCVEDRNDHHGFNPVVPAG